MFIKRGLAILSMRKTVSVMITGLLISLFLIPGVIGIPTTIGQSSGQSNLIVNNDVLNPIRILFEEIENLWNEIAALSLRMSGMQTQINQMPIVKHVAKTNEPCIDDPDIGPVGWCPETGSYYYTIEEPDYTIDSFVDVEVINPFDDELVIAKVSECSMTAIVKNSDGVPHIRFACQAIPLENAQLSYILVKSNSFPA